MLFFLQKAYLIQYLRWDASGTETRLCGTDDCCGLDSPFAGEIGVCTVVEAKTVGGKEKNVLMINSVNATLENRVNLC